MTRLLCVAALAVAAFGCVPMVQTPGPDGGHLALRPVVTVYGTYPHTDKGLNVLDHGYYVELHLLYEIDENWSIGLGGGHYRADAKLPPPLPPIPQSPLEGVPVLLRLQYGRYSRAGTHRYYFTIAGGHMFYAENDFVDNESLAFTSVGVELFGSTNLDLRFEWGHLWTWESHYDQWTAGVGLSYNF
ncbi:MAG: hypothetical protein JW909_11085 [Planctomycetes bacterium]|nr:hypothetical protein [Planctomycetota bacterium]